MSCGERSWSRIAITLWSRKAWWTSAQAWLSMVLRSTPQTSAPSDPAIGVTLMLCWLMAPSPRNRRSGQTGLRSRPMSLQVAPDVENEDRIASLWLAKLADALLAEDAAAV